MIYTLTGTETVDICGECYGDMVCRHGYNERGIGVHDYRCQDCDYEEAVLVGYDCEYCAPATPPLHDLEVLETTR